MVSPDFGRSIGLTLSLRGIYIEEVLTRRSPIGITDCRLSDGCTFIGLCYRHRNMQSITTKLEPRWCLTDRMAADGLTKDRAEPIDLLRSILRNSRDQLADEQVVFDRKRAPQSISL